MMRRRMRHAVMVGIVLGLCPAAFAQPVGGQEFDLTEPLALDECVLIALAQSDRLREVEANVQSAHGASRAALSNVLPYATSGASWRRLDQSGTWIQAPYEASVNMSAGINVLDLEGIYDLRRSRTSHEAARHDLSGATTDLTSTTKEQFYVCVAALQFAWVEERAVEVAADQLRRSETLFNLGSVARSDVLQSQVNVADSELALINRRNLARIELTRLAMVMGVDPRVDLMVDTTLVVPSEDPAAPIEDWMRIALERRPELKAARARLKAAEQNQAGLRLGRVPKLSMRYSTSLYGRGADEFLDGAHTTTSWGLQLSASMPLFEGFSRDGRIEQAAGQARASREVLERQQKEIALEVKDAFLNILKERESLAAAETSVSLARENLRLQTALYESGAGTVLEWETARLNLRRAHVAWIQAKVSLLVSHVRFQKAVGEE